MFFVTAFVENIARYAPCQLKYKCLAALTLLAFHPKAVNDIM